MIHLFLNGLAASSGAGLTYLYNVVPKLSNSAGVRTTLAVQPFLRRKFERLKNVELISPPGVSGAVQRFQFEQRRLPALIQASGANVLISTGNFALHRSPVPQILLSGNSLYTSADFYRDLWSRREYKMMIDTFARGMMAKRSVIWADQALAPSQAFADELKRWTGKEIIVVRHGFDAGAFFGGHEPLSEEISEKLRETKGCLRLLFVSHYNYYRNFETLLRALPSIQKFLPDTPVKLFLTCKLQGKSNPSGYDTRAAEELIRRLGIRDAVVELGAVPYESLHHLYRACDVYVSAAYAETFAHPLVEAMASGLPIVAADLPAHREVCLNAASYFPRFDSEHLAHAVVQVANSPELRGRLSSAGLERASEFSWDGHVLQILKLASNIRTPHGAALPMQSLGASQFKHGVMELAGNPAYASERES